MSDETMACGHKAHRLAPVRVCLDCQVEGYRVLEAENKALREVVEAAKSYIRIADNGDSRATDVRFARGVLRAHVAALSVLGAGK